MRHVIVTHVFDVQDGVTDEEIHTIVGTMTVQVEEPVVGYSDDLSMNEITIDTTNIDVGVSIEDRPHISWPETKERGTVVVLRHPHDEGCARAHGGEVCTCGLDEDLEAMFEAGRAKGAHEKEN